VEIGRIGQLRAIDGLCEKKGVLISGFLWDYLNMNSSSSPKVRISRTTKSIALCTAAGLTMLVFSSGPVSADENSGQAGELGLSESLDVDFEVKSYGVAAGLFEGVASVYKPSYTAGLKMKGPVRVVTEDVTVVKGKVKGGNTDVSASYGTKAKGFTVYEKVTGTGWPSDIEVMGLLDSYQKAGKVKIEVGPPGNKSEVVAQKWCAPKDGGDCSEENSADGAISFTVGKKLSDDMDAGKKGSVMAGTDIVIESMGLPTEEVMEIASSMFRIPPGFIEVGRGLLTRAMNIACETVQGQLTFAATERLRVLGSIEVMVRVVSRDGVPVAAAPPPRGSLSIDVTLVGGRVTECVGRFN